MKKAKGTDSKYFTVILLFHPFQTTKKGSEISQLQDALNGNDQKKVKEAVKKVIALMTIGKDSVAQLFPHVIKSMGTLDIELKKLIYLYIINYARSQPEECLLVVNMFQRDATEHASPLVRALAIRTMSCIRVAKITQHLCDPLKVGLKDEFPYVRKTAAVAVAKLYDIAPELVEEHEFLDVLRRLVGDENAMVVSNAVAALAEISEASGVDQFRMSSKMLLQLLHALEECTEWGQVFILDALSKYDASAKEAKQICDRVVAQLQHANRAIVMSTIKVVLQMLRRVEEDSFAEKMASKLGQPLVTFLSASSPPEMQYVALKNIQIILEEYPDLLDSQYKVFFCKYNDAPYVKLAKLEIMLTLADDRNIDHCLSELKEYAQGVDIDFVRKSVSAIGRCAIKLPESATKCVNTLVSLIRTKISYVVQESVIVIKDIFRRYPRQYEKIIIDLCENLTVLDEPDAKAGMVWILGEYAERIEDAPERLEYFVDSFGDEPQIVQLQLLSAIVKLFLKRHETKALLKKTLNYATTQIENPDLRDRAFIYWRLLAVDAVAAKKIVLAPRPIISPRENIFDKKFLSEMIGNLSTLASVYHKLPSQFVKGHKSVTVERWEDHKQDEDSEEEESEYDGSYEDEESEYEEEEEEEEQGDQVDQPDIKENGPAGGSQKSNPYLQKHYRSVQRVSSPDSHPTKVGLGISFSKKGDTVYLQAIIQNGTGQTIQGKGCGMKFAPKNFLGLVTSALRMQGPVAHGSTGKAMCAIKMGAEPTKNEDGNTTVQLAFKRAGVQKLTVVPVHVPTHLFLNQIADPQPKLFLGVWQKISDESAKLIHFDKSYAGMMLEGPDFVLQTLEQAGFSCIRKVDIKDDKHYFFIVHFNGVLVASEVAIQNNGKSGKIRSKSTNPYYALMVSQAVARLLIP